MDRRQIWSAMKRLCRKAGVAPSKVFPHNLRHLFATAYYRVYHDRGIYKGGCSMKKVCVSIFLITLRLAAIVPASAAGTLHTP